MYVKKTQELWWRIPLDKRGTVWALKLIKAVMDYNPLNKIGNT